MTRVPDTAFDIWKQFKEVHIGCSIDAVEDLAYYIRYPGKWDDIQANIIKLGNADCRNLVAKFSPTISVFNILGFLELVDWLHSNPLPRIRVVPSFHILEGPGFQNIQSLPKETKDWIVVQYNEWYAGAPWRMRHKTQFDTILSYMQAQDRSHLLADLKEHTAKLDNHRNQQLADYVPWLAKILENT
jgi:sulfatase maturation enzyme AslB (radical SAM superfamily)